MPVTFADLGVPADICRSLRARHIETAFPIQQLAIPPAMSGSDLCGKAPTGSGKTIAFGVPVALRARGGRPNRPVGLVLAPTRELAAQITAELGLLMNPKRVAAFYGGVGFGAQLAALRRGIDVAVACPGRLKDLIERGACSLADVSLVVIDEADRMADMGFLPEVRRLLDQVQPDRQTLLFSATLDGEVDTLIKRYQQSPIHVSVAADPASTAPAPTHHWVPTQRDSRVKVTADWIDEHGSTVVFCRTKHGTDRVAKQLVAAGVKAVPIHGGRTQGQRERALEAFAGGRAKALVATDVAARGIHVDGVACVVHFDLPATDKDYTHRSGRTGRAGAAGVVVALVPPDGEDLARELQRALAGGAAVSKAAQASARTGSGSPSATAGSRTANPSGARRGSPAATRAAGGGRGGDGGAGSRRRRQGWDGRRVGAGG